MHRSPIVWIKCGLACECYIHAGGRSFPKQALHVGVLTVLDKGPWACSGTLACYTGHCTWPGAAHPLG